MYDEIFSLKKAVKGFKMLYLLYICHYFFSCRIHNKAKSITQTQSEKLFAI